MILKTRCKWQLGAALLMVWNSGLLCGSEPPSPPSQDSGPAVQKQLEQLREGEERILAELAEIRATLQRLQLVQGVTGQVGAAASVQRKPVLLPINVHGEPFRGSKAAQMGIIEFSDFNCSHCAKYQSEVFPKLVEEYISTGKLKYYFRDLPAPGDTNAFYKACAARCAGEQGKFFEMHDLLFAHQPERSEAEISADAQGLGLDVEKFKVCLNTGKYMQSVLTSVRAAERMGIFGTPAFLLGTVDETGDFFRPVKLLVGGDSYKEIQEAVASVLARRPGK